MSAIISRERGQTTTLVYCTARDFVSPIFIFKRERMNNALEKNGPIDTIYHCSKSGWIREDLLLEWLKHFAQCVYASKENPVLVVSENRFTNSYQFCRENGIVLVLLPPHTLHAGIL